MCAWGTVQMLNTKTPAEDRKGWKFPYQGDEWPTKDNWYLVWLGKKNGNPPSEIWDRTEKKWWDSKKQAFLATGNRDCYAWRKMTEKDRQLERNNRFDKD